MAASNPARVALGSKVFFLLVSLPFGAGEKKVIAVASPRFSVLARPPENTVRCELWQREVIRDDGSELVGGGEA